MKEERSDIAIPYRPPAGTLTSAGPAPFDSERTIRPSYDQLLTLVQHKDGAAPRLDALEKGPLEEREALGARFDLRDEIGRGGAGIVYRAFQKSLHRDVAIKTIRSAPEPLCDTFVTEARVSAELDHPGVVPVHDLLETKDGLALVMKLVRGKSWRTLLHPEDGEEPKDLDFHLDILLSVANAVAFAHSKGLLHNDLKPANVLVGEFGEVLVADWGLVVNYRDPPDPTSVAPHKSTVQQPSGTPSYWAPELARGEGAALGPWTDVYLLGGILFEIAVGRPPHPGGDLMSAFLSATSEEPPTVETRVSPQLVAVFQKAMAYQPRDRYQTVAAFQEAVRGVRKHRESERIAAEAAEKLERAVGASTTTVQSREDPRRFRLYTELAEIASAYKQALLLWPQNPLALAGERAAIRTFARLALTNGDLGLAEVQLARLDRSEAKVAALHERLGGARAERKRSQIAAQRARRGIIAAAVLLVVGLATALVVVSAQRRENEEQTALANARLAGIRRLADVKLLAQLTAEAGDLWPALPERVPQLTDWMERAKALSSRLPGHRAHVESLREAAGAAGPPYKFKAPEEQWEHDTLAALVDDLEAFQTGLMADMEKRLAFAKAVSKITLEDAAADWERAVASIANPAECPAYAGLRIKPQLGLIPLGRDPKSGLWEFAHVASGERPVRAASGALVIGERTGVVLVLLPGGKFRMGTEPPGKKHRKDEPNVDPTARPSEGPIHEVSLVPFFLAKHEFTQGQWVRATGENPSAYAAGADIGGRRLTLLHPVEQLGWTDAKRVLAHLGLVLPTEAQWEYAARGGTTSVYFTGDQEISLAGYVNLADRYSRENGGPASWLFETWLDDGYVVHSPVGHYKPNRFGLHDMIGNVWEFVEDRYGPYTLPVRPGTGERMVQEDTPRVFRGGGFRSSAVHARSADRYSLYAPDYRGFDVGVRAARALE